MLKKGILTVLIIFLCFFTGGYLYHSSKVHEVQDALHESALFAAEPLWNFDLEILEGYLKKTSEDNNFSNLKIIGAEGDILYEISSYKEKGVVAGLANFGLIPEVSLEEVIIYDGESIGEIIVIWKDDSILGYSYFTVIAFLLCIISFLYMNMLEAKKKIEKQFVEVKKQKEYIENLFNVTPEGLVTLNSLNEAVTWNHSFEKIVSIWAEITSISFDLLKERFISMLAQQVNGLKNGQYSMSLEGYTVNIEYSSTEVPSFQEVATLVSLRDVTKLVSMERQLAQSQKLESVGRLAAGIAHEINTPTQYVLSNIDFLLDSNQDISELMQLVVHFASQDTVSNFASIKEKISEQLEEVDWDFLKEEIPKALSQSQDGLQRIANIVMAMKHFSHPSGDNPDPSDINNAIKSTVSVARNEWKYVADVDFELDSSLPEIPCYLDQLNQVFLIMIVNSAHAVAEKFGEGIETKGKIIIETKRLEESVEIIFRDNGCGMPESVKAKMFEPFFTTKAVDKGTGQGLAIAYDVIINKHCGTITADSEEGEGTVFIITIPFQSSKSD